MMPCNKSDDVSNNGFLYGVSLVLNCNAETVPDNVSIEFFKEKNHKITWSQDNDKPKLSIFIDSNVDDFNQLLRKVSLPDMIKKKREEQASSDDQSSANLTLGIALVSHQNVIPSMRKSLSRFYGDISSIGSAHSPRGTIAVPLGSILASFRSKEAEPILSSLLNPYLDFGHSSVMSNKPSSLSDQKKMFESSAIEALVESIPPIPLALLFVTALLEQKIIFTSRRRSSLISMTVALKKLLEPLEWSHLFVPVVPGGLASDLMQYPAPFILGMPFSVGSMSLLKNIPDDVTIVDVDVGRVMLAKNFSVHFDPQSGSDILDEQGNSKQVGTIAALRTQVLHLAETMGAVIGAKQSDILWTSDSPNVDSVLSPMKQRKGEAVQNVCNSFIRELLAGKLISFFARISYEEINSFLFCHIQTLIFPSSFRKYHQRVQHLLLLD
jgi:hypothetical protein